LSTIGNHYISTSLSTIGNDYVGGNQSTIGKMSIGSNIAFPNNVVVGTASLASGTVTGQFIKKGVSTIAALSTSYVYLTHSTFVNPGFLSAENLGTGGFVIVSYSTLSATADTGTVNWFLINPS
jgi:hypothetical protein